MKNEDIRLNEIHDLDRVVHEPARLAILYCLSAGFIADFTYLSNMTGVTPGSLSKHLRKLEDAGMVKIHKSFFSRRPRTQVSITSSGKAAVEDHWRTLTQAREKFVENREGFEETRDTDDET